MRVHRRNKNDCFTQTEIASVTTVLRIQTNTLCIPVKMTSIFVSDSLNSAPEVLADTFTERFLIYDKPQQRHCYWTVKDSWQKMTDPSWVDYLTDSGDGGCLYLPMRASSTRYWFWSTAFSHSFSVRLCEWVSSSASLRSAIQYTHFSGNKPTSDIIVLWGKTPYGPKLITDVSVEPTAYVFRTG